jgi:hypothetical protein
VKNAPKKVRCKKNGLSPAPKKVRNPFSHTNSGVYTNSRALCEMYAVCLCYIYLLCDVQPPTISRACDFFRSLPILIICFLRTWLSTGEPLSAQVCGCLTMIWWWLPSTCFTTFTSTQKVLSHQPYCVNCLIT